MPRESAWKKHFCSCYLDVCPVLICISGFSLSPLCPLHFFPSRWFFKVFFSVIHKNFQLFYISQVQFSRETHTLFFFFEKKNFCFLKRKKNYGREFKKKNAVTNYPCLPLLFLLLLNFFFSFILPFRKYFFIFSFSVRWSVIVLFFYFYFIFYFQPSK